MCLCLARGPTRKKLCHLPRRPLTSASLTPAPLTCGPKEARVLAPFCPSTHPTTSWVCLRQLSAAEGSAPGTSARHPGKARAGCVELDIHSSSALPSLFLQARRNTQGQLLLPDPRRHALLLLAEAQPGHKPCVPRPGPCPSTSNCQAGGGGRLIGQEEVAVSAGQSLQWPQRNPRAQVLVATSVK